jgi:hypothetical protein
MLGENERIPDRSMNGSWHDSLAALGAPGPLVSWAQSLEVARCVRKRIAWQCELVPTN